MTRTDGLFEVKYMVPRGKRNYLLSVLKQKADAPLKFARANLKTIYFDDADRASYFDSADGNLVRKKFRLREYVQPESGGAFYSLEIKIRTDAKTSKLKKLIYVQLPHGYRITSLCGLIDVFEEITGERFLELRHQLAGRHLTPSIVVEYKRFRAEDRRYDKRYNFDTDIKVYPCATLDEGIDGFFLGYDIFEVKSAEYEAFPDFLKGCDMESLSMSKFMWASEIFE